MPPSIDRSPSISPPRSKHLASVLTALTLLLVTTVLYPGLYSLDESFVDSRYNLRGEIRPDTNIVLVYFDADDISALGGWPLRRNYYALLIEIISKLEARAIGVDVFLGTKNREFPEYDTLLAAVIQRSGNVVLSSYYRSVTSIDPIPPPQERNSQDEASAEMIFWRGEGYHPPHADLAAHAAAIGHTNFLEQSIRKVPTVVTEEEHVVRAFFAEVLSLYGKHNTASGLKEKGERGADRLPALGEVIREGQARANFVGPLSAFRSYRSVDVIRSFEYARLGLEPLIPTETFRGKIVLLGVVAEGLGSFYSTPFSRGFAPIGVHATLIENALQDRFMKSVDRWGGFIVTLFMLLIVMGVVYWRDDTIGFLVIGAFLVAYLVLSQIAFSWFNVVFPVVQPAVVLIIPLAIMVVFEHRATKVLLDKIRREKDSMESRLREKEIQLGLLERELVDEATDQTRSPQPELMERVKQIKDEIRLLSSQVADMESDHSVVNAGSGISEFEEIVYDRQSKMANVVALIGKVAHTNANILVLGESGTGKELVAKAIHRQSGRKGGPFVAVNCGALTETLLESELFGHEKGAFTGAVKDKPGRFELANNGTILLDEIAETSPGFQVKLLRVLQEGEFERVGSTKTSKADVRIIAATNKNLKTLIEEKKFREDLYYRLNVFSIEIPPLRDRLPDIVALTTQFLRNEDRSLAVSETVMDLLSQYRWPGNVRELETAIKRAAILAKSEHRSLLRVKDFPPEIQSAANTFLELEDKILDLLRAKKFSRSSISETANELGGLNRGTVGEYFRGLCFASFFEHKWNIETSAKAIAGTDDPDVATRVEKKLSEYVHNLVSNVDRKKPFEEVRSHLHAKYKNLPQRFHYALDEAVRAFLEGKWS